MFALDNWENASSTGSARFFESVLGLTCATCRETSACSVHSLHPVSTRRGFQFGSETTHHSDGWSTERSHGTSSIQVSTELLCNDFDKHVPSLRINKKIPRGPPSPPAPILHSPTRKVTVKEQADWKIPPCISNWKNAKVKWTLHDTGLNRASRLFFLCRVTPFRWINVSQPMVVVFKARISTRTSPSWPKRCTRLIWRWNWLNEPRDYLDGFFFFSF